MIIVNKLTCKGLYLIVECIKSLELKIEKFNKIKTENIVFFLP